MHLQLDNFAEWPRSDHKQQRVREIHRVQAMLYASFAASLAIVVAGGFILAVLL